MKTRDETLRDTENVQLRNAEFVTEHVLECSLFVQFIH